MTEIQTFIESLMPNTIDIHHDSIEDSKTIKHTVGNIRLEFYLHYETKILNYLPPTYSSPEECDFVFINTDHEEIALFINEEAIDLTETQVAQIDSALELILY